MESPPPGSPGSRRRRLVLVAGPARSGTTVTDLVLGAAPGRFSCGEVYGWFRPWRPKQLRMACRCGTPGCDLWRAIGRPRPSDFHATVAELTGSDVVVDSSKSLTWIADSAVWARRRGWGSCMVLTWKTPRHLAESYYRRAPGEASVVRARDRFVWYYRHALDLPLDRVAVRNGDLQDRPTETVRSLSSALGLDVVAGQEEFWRWPHHHVCGSPSAVAQLRQGRPVGRAATPEGFDELWERLGFAADAELAAVVDALTGLDHSNVAPGSGPFPAGGVSRTLRGRPAWIWRLRARDLWRTAKLAVRNRGLRRVLE